MRVTCGVNTMVSDAMALTMPAPSAPDSAMASSTDGNAKNTSTVRMIAVLSAAAHEARDDADRRAGEEREHHRQQAHQQRQPAAIDEAAQHVAAEFVRAERVERIADRPQAAQHRAAIGIGGRDPRREDRGEHDRENDDGGDDGDRIAQQPAADAGPVAASDPPRREATARPDRGR